MATVLKKLSFCFSSALSLDQWEDAHSPGHVIRRSQKPTQQMVKTSGIHGRAGIQQRMAGQNWEGESHCVSYRMALARGHARRGLVYQARFPTLLNHTWSHASLTATNILFPCKVPDVSPTEGREAETGLGGNECLTDPWTQFRCYCASDRPWPEQAYIVPIAVWERKIIDIEPRNKILFPCKTMHYSVLEAKDSWKGSLASLVLIVS